MSTNLPALIATSEIETMAEHVSKSRLFPGVTTKEAAFTLMLLCQSEGLHPMQALRRFHIIDGKPSMKADAMLASFLVDGGKVDWHERTDDAVDATFTHPKGGTIRVRWDWDTVQQAQLDKGNHRKYPRAMKTARVISEAIRVVAPHIIVGIYSTEEYEDMQPEQHNAIDTPKPAEAIDVTPAKPKAAPKGRPARPVQRTAAETPRTEPVETLAAIVDAIVKQRDPYDPESYKEGILATLAARAIKAQLMIATEADDPEARIRALEGIHQSNPTRFRATLTQVVGQVTDGLSGPPDKADDVVIDVTPEDRPATLPVPAPDNEDGLSIVDTHEGPQIYIPDSFGDSYELTGEDVCWFRDQLEKRGHDLSKLWRNALTENQAEGAPKNWPSTAVANIYDALVNATARRPNGAA